MKTNSILNGELQVQKSTNILIGLIMGLALMFVALESTQREKKLVVDEPIYQSVTFEDDLIPVTFHQEVMSPPPAAAPTVAEFINEIDDIIEIPDLEMDFMGPADISIPGNNVVPGVTVITGPGPIAPPNDPDEIIIPDVDPKFPGDVYKWLGEHLKYPAICQEQGIQGRVIVTFVVNTDGTIVGVKTVRSKDVNLSMEAERVVKMMPKWIPGRKNDKPVRSRFDLPILFRLN